MSNKSGMIGARFYSHGKALTIFEEYEGHGPDDPSGYYYSFDGESATHWISASALPVRFTKEKPEGDQ